MHALNCILQKAVLRRTVRWLFVAACWLRVRVTVSYVYSIDGVTAWSWINVAALEKNGGPGFYA